MSHNRAAWGLPLPVNQMVNAPAVVSGFLKNTFTRKRWIIQSRPQTGEDGSADVGKIDWARKGIVFRGRSRRFGSSSVSAGRPLHPGPAEADSGGTLTDAAGSISGPVLIGLPTGTVLLNGALAGTLTGTTLTYTISVPSGGVLSQPRCSGQIAGTTTLTGASTMNGAYSVAASTCPTGLSTGTFSLARQ